MAQGRFVALLDGEITAVRKDRWMFAFVIWLPPAVSLFLLLIFAMGQPVNLPIGVVDLDQSSSSRKISRYLNASPALEVTRHYTSLAEGKADISSANIFALVVIPANLARSALRGESPAITAFFNAQYLLIGKVIRKALLEIETTLAVEFDVGKILVRLTVVNAALAEALPVRSQITALYNSNMNYATFLVPTLLAAMFQLLIICTTILSLGRPENEWQNDSIKDGIVALLTRLSLYTGVYSIHILISLAFLYGVLDWPHRPSLTALAPLVFLFVMACQLLGAFFYVLTFDLVRSLSFAGAFSAPAFAFLGVTFPASGMGVFAQFWRDLMPASHYLDGFLSQQSYASGIVHSIQPGFILLLFTVLLPVVAISLSDHRKVAA